MSSLLSLPPSGQRTRIAGLHGSADALALARLSGSGRALTVITATAADAQRLLEELRYFAPSLRSHLLPDWETLPYDNFSPHQDLVSERLATLYQVVHGACDVLLVPVTTALYRLPPPQFLAAYSFFLKQGEAIEPEALRRQLTMAGYSHVSQVVSPGEYSYRGGLIDLFPMGSAVPYRIDLLDNEVETVRTFDVDTQRSIYKVKEVRLLPAREFPTDEEARTRFRGNFRTAFEGDPSKRQIYKDVSNGTFPAGIEYYLPLFFDATAILPDYLPADTVVCLHGEVGTTIDDFWRDTRARYELLRGDRDRPLLPPAELFLLADQFFGAIKPFARVELRGNADPADAQDARSAPLPPLQVDRRADNPLHRLADFLASHTGCTLLCAETLGRRETLLQYLTQHGLTPVLHDTYAQVEHARDALMLTVAPIANGFI
ncbi:MAG: transcription-repair coupling factor, partial [Burkholderiales bacterium]|nr:transcription-repair coupling factor [Burkholderiales bacterium]